MSDSEKKYSISKIGEEKEVHGNWHISTKSFDPNDPLSELEALYMPEQKAPKKEKTDKEKKIEELTEFKLLLRQRVKDFEKAKKKRIGITVLFFTAVYFVISMVIDGTGISEILSAGIWEFIGNVFVALFFAVIHVLANSLIFGQLATRNREELDILKRIDENIKELENEIGQ